MSYAKLLKKHDFSFGNFEEEKFPIVPFSDDLMSLVFDSRFQVDFDDLESETLAPMESRLDLGILYFNSDFCINEAFPTPLLCTLHGIVVYDPHGNYADTSTPPDYQFITYDAFNSTDLVGCKNNDEPGLLVDLGTDQIMLSSNVEDGKIMVSKDEIMFIHRILTVFLEKGYKSEDGSVEIDNTHCIFLDEIR